MHYSTFSDLQRLVDHRVPEGPSLDYKRELHLQSRSEKLEALKDLTGIGNGGGGTMLFGIDESDGDFPEAEAIVPMTDRTLVGRLEDIVHAGVRPPLLMEYSIVEADDGFVLAVHVQPSGLGPYMVQAYGDSRYHQRIGTRTVPMSEQQVRDAYAIAIRSREHRADLWRSHAFPMSLDASDEPWISISALPEEPLQDVLVPGSVDIEALRPNQALRYHADQFGLTPALHNLTRWADGLYGHDGSDRHTPNDITRLHRDGAAGVAIRLRSELNSVLVGRVANSTVAYLGWFWHQVDLRRPVEILCRVENLRGAVLRRPNMFGEDRRLQEPPGVVIDSVEVQAELFPWEVGRAAVRHRLVRRLVDRLRQALGSGNGTSMFEDGQLYGADQRPARYSIGGAGVWQNTGQTALAHLYDDGRILDNHSNLIAYLHEGVVLDVEGHTIAVTELATGPGCPDDFLPEVLTESPFMVVPGGNAGEAHATTAERATIPTATRLWSPRPLAEVLQAP